MSLSGEREDGNAERAALRRKRDATGRWDNRRERRVQANGRIEVEQAHAVGSDHPHAVIADFRDQLLLQVAAAGSSLRESGAHDNERSHARGGAVVDHGENR